MASGERFQPDGGSGADEGRSPRSPRKPFLVRLPPRMLDDLKAWAAQDLRSLNAQIEYLLADALRRRKGGSKE